MAKDHSFDIVSEVNMQEVKNAVEQAKKEVLQRYDFKGSQSVLDLDEKEKKVTLQTENESRLKALGDIVQTKFAKRSVPLKNIEFGPPERAQGGSQRQTVQILQGIPKDKAKEIVQFIKQSKLKVQPQIQQDQVRVQSAKIDSLQELIQVIKAKDFGLELQFINYR